ncbi:hypothetical protein L484_011985 [Morus notabilis]|uniref:Uncharacterized protein n=1 Tax=Morus notabilis TaxID=981085 RepID=W9S5Y5_9ROSA|nr:hypothetical protein L484_011985 [Morus notabilis]
MSGGKQEVTFGREAREAKVVNVGWTVTPIEEWYSRETTRRGDEEGVGFSLRDKTLLSFSRLP